MLALGVQADPGVYAVLLGSGVSTGAGIPTGWGVVRELVRRAAVATAPDVEGAGDVAAEDPEAWWAEHGDGQPLGYSNLLAALAPSSAARQGLLRSFFQATPEEVEQGLKVPSAAHRQVAELVRSGAVRVVLTTNFDRLLERALDDAGVAAQILATPEALSGMTPLQHAEATVIKLHGDFTHLEIRNTVDELAAYPSALQDLLERVLDEYGLLISGWSGEWDTALVSAMESRSSRRYPVYWDSRSSRGDVAQRLLNQHAGRQIVAADADQLFTRLTATIDALEKLTEPPLTTAMAVTRLKQSLLDRTRRIVVEDLVSGMADVVVDRALAMPVSTARMPYAEIEPLVADLVAATTPLIQLVATGVWYDRERNHTDLWAATVQRLMTAKRTPPGSYVGVLQNMRHLPALLVLRSAGIVAVAAGRDDVLLDLLRRPTWREHHGEQRLLPAFIALREDQVLDHEVVNAFPRWGENGGRWWWPLSHLLRLDLREPLRAFLPDDADYDWTCDRYEYRVALAQRVLPLPDGWWRPPSVPGLFLGENRWTSWGETAEPQSGADFSRSLAEAEDSPWRALLGDLEEAPTVMGAFTEELRQRQRGR
ncbi:MAG: SIR2-like protein [Frankiales bacterium]|nr:SIR2-like protein [Frankiales bacterium]